MEGDYLYHERCTKELRKTYKLTEAGRKGGLPSDGKVGKRRKS